MAQTSIFISHSRHDNEWCRPLVAALKVVGYDVWYDEEVLQGGDAWVAKIQQEVQNREVFLIVLTPEAWESQWVQDELQLAIATRRRILPVLLRNTQVSGFLLTTQWITVIGEEPQVAARAVIKAIEEPPAPGRNAVPEATTERLDDLIVQCRSLAAEKRYTEALSACNRALALDPKNVGVLKIKVRVVNAVGDTHLEARTWFEILLADPNEWHYDSYRDGLRQTPLNPSVMWDSLNEKEAVQAYSLLRSRIQDSFGQRVQFARDMLTALARLDCLDTAMDILAPIGDESFRKQMLMWIRPTERPNLFVRLIETWYDFPPRLSSISDLDTLDAYAGVLDQEGRASDAKAVHELIVRIFDGAYGDVCGRLWLPQQPPWGYSDESRNKYRIYLASLDAIGRARDAERLRKAYGSVQ